MRVLHEVVKVIVLPLEKDKMKRFVVRTREFIELKCVLILVSYCCAISNGKDMPPLQHIVAEKRPCILFIVTGKDIISGREGSERSLEDTTMVRKIYMVTPKKRSLKLENGTEKDEKAEVDSSCSLLNTYLLS